jgi:hypothetical protein
MMGPRLVVPVTPASPKRSTLEEPDQPVEGRMEEVLEKEGKEVGHLGMECEEEQGVGREEEPYGDETDSCFQNGRHCRVYRVRGVCLDRSPRSRRRKDRWSLSG